MPSKFICFLLLTSFIKVSIAQNRQLPPILDYYPGCDYQVLGELSEKGSVTLSDTKVYVNREYQQDLAKILFKLQSSAAELGADAVIITQLVKSQRVKDRELSKVNRDSVYQYSGLAIQNCVNENESLRRPSGFDQNGMKGRTLKLSQINTQFDVNIAIQQKATLRSLLDGQTITAEQFKQKKLLQNKHVLLSGSIYGVSLGMTRAQIIQELGYPSAEFRLFSGIESLVYGRRHWLHFQQDKLISVEFSDQILSYESLNILQALDEFDQFEWLIEGKIKNNSPIETARSLFTDKAIKEQNRLLTVSENGVQLNLMFDTEYDPFSKNSKKFLVGFSLAYSDAPTFNATLAKAPALNLQALIDLAKAGEKPDEDTLVETLTEPLGRLFADHNTYFDIYNNHTMLKYNSLKMAQLNLREEVFKAPRVSAAKAKWKVTEQIFEGATAKAISEHYAEDVSFMYSKGQIVYPRLNIVLLLDGDDEDARVYASDFIFDNL